LKPIKFHPTLRHGHASSESEREQKKKGWDACRDPAVQRREGDPGDLPREGTE